MYSFSSLLDLLKVLLTAWRQGGRKVRIVIVGSILLMVFGGGLLFISDQLIYPYGVIFRDAGGVIIGAGVLGALIIYGLQKSKEEVKREEKIEEVEQRVKENPKEPQAAWELARVKLESYLNRNLSQVKSIFLLTAFVMVVGFALIIVGAYKAFNSPEQFKASVLSSLSGIIVSFVGGTFLVLYRSTMAQAKDYVTILERINAVGMSVQILDSLTDADLKLKNQTTAEVAKQLLSMYSATVPTPKARASAAASGKAGG